MFKPLLFFALRRFSSRVACFGPNQRLNGGMLHAGFSVVDEDEYSP